MDGVVNLSDLQSTPGGGLQPATSTDENVAAIEAIVIKSEGLAGNYHVEMVTATSNFKPDVPHIFSEGR